MKKLVAILLTSLLLLTACARQESADGTTAAASDPNAPAGLSSALIDESGDNTYLVSDNFQNLTESDSTIYKLVIDRIYYYDKASGISGPLCGKPDCNHTDNDCDAYISTGFAIEYYNQSLYFIAYDHTVFPAELWLWKADSNGQNREKIKQLDLKGLIIPNQPQTYFIHKGQLFLFCLTDIVENGVPMMRAAILSSPLDDSQEFTTLWEEKSESVLHYTYRFSDQYVYVGSTYNGRTVHIFRINFLDGSTESLFSEDGQGYLYGEIHLTKQNELYLSGATETTVYVWKIENGQKVNTITIESDSEYPPKILDGLVIDTRQNEDNKRVATVKTLSGETVYEGLLFPNGIPEMEAELDLNTCNYGEVGGTGSLIAFYMGADAYGTKPAEYIVYLDTAQNMKPVLIFPC